MREIETLVKILSTLAEVQKAVEQCATFRETVRIQDVYWEHPHRQQLQTGGRGMVNALRLRNRGDLWFLTLKHDNMNEDGVWLYSDEYETEVGDLTQLKKILEALNFRSLVMVDKTRQTWFYKDFEIALDSVKNLGEFVEIEYKGEAQADPKETTDQMVKLLKDIGCGEIKINYMGYPYLLLFPKEAKYETL